MDLNKELHKKSKALEEFCAAHPEVCVCLIGTVEGSARVQGFCRGADSEIINILFTLAKSAPELGEAFLFVADHLREEQEPQEVTYAQTGHA